MLGVRTVGFAVFQGLVAVAYLLRGVEDAWTRSIAWWPLTATATSAVTFALLVSFLRAEGLRYRDLLRIDRSRVRRDVVLVAGLVVVAGLLAVVPNFTLASVLFGDPSAPVEVMFQPLPVWALVAGLVLFPVSIAATELPAYFAYAQPRLEALTGRTGLAVAVAVGFLSVQHTTLPLVLSADFVVWRALMFLPLAALFGIVLRWRPRLLPYLMAVHLLADLQAVLQVAAAS